MHPINKVNSESSSISNVTMVNHVKSSKKAKWLDRQAKWIVDGVYSGNTIAKILRTLLLLPPSTGLLGLPFSLPLNRKIEEAFSIKEFELLEKTPPKINHDISIKTKQQTFNHVSDFVIEEGIIWTKPRNRPAAEWKPMYFDGFPQLTPQELHVDGANLIVLDQHNGVHYKKVIREHFDENTREYHYNNKALKINWKKEWYSFPLIKHIVNIFTGKRLHLPKDMKGWAIGHRGQYNHYYTDAKGFKHPVSTGVTTLYVLDKSGKNIYMFDPWKPKNVLVKMPVPETTDEPFAAEHISVSAATIMLSGFVEKDGIKVPAIKTFMADIDTLGWNPILKYSYDPKDHEENHSVRILPSEQIEWKTHDIPQEASISSFGSIFQTGEGNEARELRVPGVFHGTNGYFRKNISDDKWDFIQDDTIDIASLMASEPSQGIESKAGNWKGGNASLESYIEDIPMATLKVGQEEKILHRRENIILKILSGGKNFHHYDLVDNQGRNKIPVKIVQKGDKLKIVERGLFGKTLYSLIKQEKTLGESQP